MARFQDLAPRHGFIERWQELRDLGSNSLLPDFVAVLIRTKWFVRDVQFHLTNSTRKT